MPLVDKRIYRISSDTPSNLSPKQIGLQASNDSDLGFKTLYWKDAVGGINQALAKSQPGWLESLKCSEELWLGDSKEVQIEFATNQTPDALMVGLAAVSNSMMICRKTDMGTDYGLGLYTDPTLVLKAAGTTLADRTEISHGLIHAFSGDLQVNANNWYFDADYDSFTITGSPLTGNIVVGEDHTIDTQYTSHTALFGQGNSVNADHAIIGGYINDCDIAHFSIVCGSYNLVDTKDSVVGGYYNVLSADRCAIFGQENELTDNVGIVAGYQNTVESGSCICAGSSNIINNTSAFTAVFGQSNISNAQHNIVAGKSNTVTNSYSIVACRDNTVSGTASACFGRDNTLGANYSLIAGYDNISSSAASYTLTHGYNNTNNMDFSMVYGQYAKSEWPGTFYSLVRLDGATIGDSQIFHTTQLSRKTTATTKVPLTSDGTGSVSPLVIQEGYTYFFDVNLIASNVSGGGGRVFYKSYKVRAWNNSTYGVECDFDETYTESEGTDTALPLGTVAFEANDTDGTVEMNITPGTTEECDFIAHIFGGVKGRSDVDNQPT